MEQHKNISIIGGAIEDGVVKMTRTYPKTTKQFIASIQQSVLEKLFSRKVLSIVSSIDLALWYDALANGFEVSNLDDVVLQLRVTKDFYKRRSYKKAFGFTTMV